jgi:hypothetical protein
MPNPLCCASPGYPNSVATTCQCSNYVCNDTPNQCICGLDISGTGTARGTSCGSAHAYCCEHTLSDGTVNQCTCGPFPCQTGDTQVSACTTSVFACQGDTLKVAACR